jgi:hypothetical protein
MPAPSSPEPPATPQLPDTAVGKRVRWYIERLGEAAPLSEQEFEAGFEPSATIFAPPLRDPRAWPALAGNREAFGTATIVVRSDTEIEVEGATPQGRRWRHRFSVDPVSTRFSEFILEWIQEEEVTVRFATEADGPVLADIERRSPMVLGPTTVTIDRGDDYFAAARLMEEVTIAVAEVDGVPGAVNCAAAHTVQVGGRPYRMGYFHHLRILPEHQRKGLFQQLGQALSSRYMPPHVDGTYAYVSPENAASQRLFSFTEAWPVQPLMCELPVAGLRGPPAGRPAEPADAEAIVATLNRCHRDEEMFCPYTVPGLTARLGRSPHEYSWSSLRITDRAVAGVWPAGDYFTVITESPEGRRVEREGFVLDHGLVPGGEDDYRQLLRSWCAELDDRGFTKLVTFTSQWSPNYSVLVELEADMQPFDLFVFGPATREGADRRGVYVDLIYF